MIYKNSVRTSQETHSLRYKEQPVNAVYGKRRRENITKYTNTSRGWNIHLSMLKQLVHIGTTERLRAVNSP
jgi:hypothetical protein